MAPSQTNRKRSTKSPGAGWRKDLTQIELPQPKYENVSQLGSGLLVFWRGFLYAALVLPLMPVQVLLLAIGSKYSRRLPVWFHKVTLRIIGVKVTKRGRPNRDAPTLFVSNHVSYFDIPVLGSLVEGSFVAKSEIRDWPFFGWLARMQRCLFINRDPRQAKEHAQAMQERLENKENLILFPEGTTGNGVRVAPFKSSLFSVAQLRPDDQPLKVQPVSIAYTHLDGMRMGRNFRFFFAWFGAQDLAPHLVEALKLGQLTVIVEFHPVVTFEEFGKRQALASHCHNQISDSMAEAIVGRSQVGNHPSL